MRNSFKVTGADEKVWVVTLETDILSGLTEEEIKDLARRDQFSNIGNNSRKETSKLSDPEAILAAVKKTKGFEGVTMGATIAEYVAPEKGEASEASLVKKLKKMGFSDAQVEKVLKGEV